MIRLEVDKVETLTTSICFRRAKDEKINSSTMYAWTSKGLLLKKRSGRVIISHPLDQLVELRQALFKETGKPAKLNKLYRRDIMPDVLAVLKLAELFEETESAEYWDKIKYWWTEEGNHFWFEEQKGFEVLVEVSINWDAKNTLRS